MLRAPRKQEGGGGDASRGTGRHQALTTWDVSSVTWTPSTFISDPRRSVAATCCKQSLAFDDPTVATRSKSRVLISTENCTAKGWYVDKRLNGDETLHAGRARNTSLHQAVVGTVGQSMPTERARKLRQVANQRGDILSHIAEEGGSFRWHARARELEMCAHHLGPRCVASLIRHTLGVCL